MAMLHWIVAATLDAVDTATKTNPNTPDAWLNRVYTIVLLLAAMYAFYRWSARKFDLALEAKINPLREDVSHLHTCFETKHAETKDQIDGILTTRTELAKLSLEQLRQNDADHVTLASRLMDLIGEKDAAHAELRGDISLLRTTLENGKAQQ